MLPVGNAWGAEKDPYEAARDADSRLDYRGVIVNGTAALNQAQTHDRLVNLYQLLGTAYGVLGKNEDAVDAFTRLLAIDPDHHLPRGSSPKITKPFKEAGGFWLDRPGGLAVTPDVPHDTPAGKPLTLNVKLDDPLQMAKTVRVSYRVSGNADFSKVETAAALQATVVIPADQLPEKPGDYQLELFVGAIGPTGSELRLAGDSAHPIVVTVHGTTITVPPEALGGTGGNVIATEPKKERGPLVKQWWFWTAIGGVVVLGVVGGTLGWYYGRDTSHVTVDISSKVGP